MVPLSLFADPERILRRLYVFAEEPCKSTITTSEPCSPVFKEVQPRPSQHSNLEYHINNLNLYLYVFGLFSIFVIKPIQPDCDKIKEISVLLLETPLTRSKYFSSYTQAQCLTRTSGTVCTFAYKQTLQRLSYQGGGPCDGGSRTHVGTTDIPPPVKNNTDSMNRLVG